MKNQKNERLSFKNFKNITGGMVEWEKITK